MEIVTGIYRSRRDAVEAVRQLQKLGIEKNRLTLLTPDDAGQRIEGTVPTTDSEEPGMGRAMGAAVGGAMGAAGGATLGLAAASLAVPGVGPVLAFGLLGAALLGAGGAVAGAAVGDTIEEGLGEGVPHEDVYLYEDALRHGHSVVIAYAADDDQADRARDVIARSGSEDIEELREDWWRELRGEEQAYYLRKGGDFERDELSYRRGFEAALHPKRRGKPYAQAEQNLRTAYNESDLDTAFRQGYERGLSYQMTLLEIRKV
jgi:hypothetical protein